MVDVVGPTTSVAVGSECAERAPRLRTVLRWLPIAIWFVALVVVMAALAISHWFALPHPDKHDTKLTAGLSELLHGSSGWAVVHVLSPECRCSQRIREHLLDSPRPAAVHELVLVVGHDTEFETRLATKGFHVTTVEPEALYQRFGIESAPLFVVVDPTNTVRYVGGYTARQQGPDIRDLEILHDLQANVATSELPVFGCAVSERLKQLADPLAIKR